MFIEDLYSENGEGFIKIVKEHRLHISEKQPLEPILNYSIMHGGFHCVKCDRNFYVSMEIINNSEILKQVFQLKNTSYADFYNWFQGKINLLELKEKDN